MDGAHSMPTPPGVPASLAGLFPEAAFVAAIGAGAYGEVWLARFPGDAWRAVKLVEGDTAAAERERRALHLLRSLSDPGAPDAPLHPALMPVADLRERPGAFAYTMPLADALRPNWRADPAQYRPRTLAAELVARRTLPLGECLDLAEALASGLAFLQRHCLVHRDLKPSNVLFLEGRPVLADFGLLADTREAGSVVGTPGYVPKEQHGEFPADLYSLGVLLAEASTGRRAGEAGFAPVAESDRHHPLFPRWLDLLRRTTDPSPARRPQTAGAFLGELRALREPRAPTRWRRRLALATLLLVLCAIGGTVAGLRHVLRPRAAGPSFPSAPATAAPAPVAPSGNRPLYISRDMAEDGAFLQLYTDRIRVGLPLHGSITAGAAALLLVLPPDNPSYDPKAEWDGPMPWRLCPLVPADEGNTPATAPGDPAYPEGAPALSRTTRAAIAMLPADTPYPEAVFLLCEPVPVWESRLAGHPDATFQDLHNLWWETCERPRSERESPMIRELMERDLLKEHLE